MDDDSVAKLKRNVTAIYKRKEAALYALCQYYAAMCLNAFLQKQSQDKFWHNRTNTAYNTVFSDVLVGKEFLGFFLAQKVEYGIYLELANNRIHESLRPTVMRFYARFEKDVEALYAD